MAQVAPAQTAPSLVSIVRAAWSRIVRSFNQTMSQGMYGEEIIFTDSLERELNARELHPYSY